MLFISLLPPGWLASPEVEGGWGRQAIDVYLERKAGQESRMEGHTKGGRVGDEHHPGSSSPV